MRLDDRLAKDQQKAAKRKNEPDPYYQEEPDGLMYMDRERGTFLNKEKGVFNKEDTKSLNSRPSVFEKYMIFDTRIPNDE